MDTSTESHEGPADQQTEDEGEHVQQNKSEKGIGTLGRF